MGACILSLVCNKIIFIINLVNLHVHTMGIHGLAKLIADHAPSSIRDNVIKSYFGKS